MIGRSIDELKLGDRAEFAKTVSESDIYLYAGVTGDLNPTSCLFAILGIKDGHFSIVALVISIG